MSALSQPFTFIRTPLFITIAIILNVAVFVLIQKLVSKDLEFDRISSSINLVDFIRVEQQPEPVEKKKPLDELEPPEPEEEPPPPEVPEPQVDKPVTSQMDLPMPSQDLPLSISGTPYLGDFAAPSRPASVKPSRPAIATDVTPTLRVPPVYPPRALRSGIEGVVTVEFTISTEGTVKDAEVVTAKPPGIFNKAVLNAISKWKFDPDIVDGKPVEKRARQDIKFTLQR
ncbi:MAG: TonB family protein [Gammaproteobacteria bacterium]